MADSKNLLAILAVGFIISTLILTVNTTSNSPPVIGWATRPGSGGTTVGDILSSDEEFEVDSEIHRRILATSNYISYGALNKDRVPCSQRGASYYNCRPGAQANPYHRGCSAITRCQR